MNPLISLVIPVYNVEKYLPRCMETVFAQTYDNFEIILVDDGSTDSSGKMCDEYAAKDDRVRVFHKENGGLSDARNFGVQKARGDLVSFIDSDDCVTEDYLQYLYDLMKKYGTDMACADETMRVTDEETHQAPAKQINEIVLNTEESLQRICYTNVSAYSKLYEKRTLLENPYPKGRIYEDLATTPKIIGSSNKVAFGNKVIYLYYIREGTLSHGIITKKSYDNLWAANEQFQYISKRYPKAINAAMFRCVKEGIRFLNNLFSYHNEGEKFHFQRVRVYVKPYLKNAFIDKHAVLSTKMACIAIWMGYYPSKIFWRMKALAKRLIK